MPPERPEVRRAAPADTSDGVPLPVHTSKWRLRLSEHVDVEGHLSEEAVGRLVEAVAAAGETAQRWGAAGPLALPRRWCAMRRTVGRCCARSASGRGVQICTLPGEVEAELTFLGARRWMGWQAGPLVLFDIGGGSLEVAFGTRPAAGLCGLAAARREPADPRVLPGRGSAERTECEVAAPESTPSAA